MEENIIKQEQEKKPNIIKVIIKTIYLIILSIISVFTVPFGIISILLLGGALYEISWFTFSVFGLGIICPLIIFIISLLEGNENIIRWIKNIISFIYVGLAIYFFYECLTVNSHSIRGKIDFLGDLIFLSTSWIYFILTRILIFFTKPPITRERIKTILAIFIAVFILVMFFLVKVKLL